MRCLVLFALLVSCTGCENSVPASSGNVSKAKPPAPIDEPKPPVFAPKADPNAKPPEPPPPPEPVEMVREVARAGVSDKGKYDSGIFTTPLTANFSLQQQMIFDSSIPKAMQVFEGIRNRKPSSHQEFMTEIIIKNSIRLPSLPPNHRYIYDPELGELMVERPKTAD